MLKKHLSFVLVILILNLSLASMALANNDSKRQTVEQIKATVSKIGIGSNSRIEIKLYDGTKIKGYVTEITDDDFSVMNEKTKSVVKIPYPQAQQAKKSHKGLAIAGIVIGVVVIIAIVVAGRN